MKGSFAMWILVLLLIIGTIIGFVVMYPFIGIPVVVILIIKRKSIKAWLDNLPEPEKQEKKTDNNNIDKATETISSVEPSVYRRSGYDPDSLDFEDEHEREIERWRNKIDKMEDSAYDAENPDTVVSKLRKTISLCDEFRDFCSLYIGGTSYYDDNEADVKERIERDLEDYLENEYEDAKESYKYLQQEKREYSALKSKILNAIISSENGMTRKDVFALTSLENKNLAERALKELTNDESISKEKRGNKWVYFI